jgi:hypothetical protein
MGTISFENLNREKLEKMIAIRTAYANKEITLDEARDRARKEVGDVSPEEFAAAEQLVKNADQGADECRLEDTKEIIHIFEGLIKRPPEELPFGHPIDAYRREVAKMKELLKQGHELLGKPFDPEAWKPLMADMMKYRVHFHRKQNQLYSALERHGFNRPSTTMWTYDDYVRDEIKKCNDLLNLGNYAAFPEAYKSMEIDCLDLMGKEELILYPTALKLIPEEEFKEMERGDREIGFFLIHMPGEPSQTTASAQAINPIANTIASPGNVASTANSGVASNFLNDLGALIAKYSAVPAAPAADDPDRLFHVAEGQLTLEQINLIFRHMPVDLSYVDENELVKFYTDTEHRIFPRSAGVIGREVRRCHPPKSVHIVEEIIEKFRTGEQNQAEFWINKPGLFIYIIYVAVRDKEGKFRGVLEMMQNCTHIRELEGSRTLLTWDGEQNGGYGQKEALEGDDGATPANGTHLELNADTRLKELVARYPKVIKDMATIDPHFKKLQSPLGKLMVQKATFGMMSEHSGVPLEKLVEGVKNLIAGYEKEK